MRILYVEDNPELRETIGMLMEGDGQTVTSCATAEEALALDAEDPFDLLVSDVSLPGMSGTDLARKVLAVDPQRWVVLCTGYELGDYASAWGPNVRTLLKPFELEDLESLLDSIRAAVHRTAA
ncbi:two-component system response regulator [Acidovorax sp. Leaf76]|uniref:response regulator n=1 Tax=unclassified Acidovorax TaxID=2684926 RepID=UPI0006F83E7D|nr:MULTISPECIES: response regulator [unclassified Acidovorax]KQO14000.1 two-component system response regulator [Acidovorax sp. Leaf76]KQO31520.1 two-component system response regulator [Acidovorax sp. Leaf84]KQS27540.1 two-component system response regulator [Acidovorax sp. Leaf191]